MWWNRNPGVFWGVVLVILGVLFLLANSGVLTNINWDYVWPLFLIALGVWLIVVRIGPGVASAAGGGREDVKAAPLGDQSTAASGDRPDSTPPPTATR